MLAVCLIGTSSKAAPGDTTWVQGNIANLSWYGNYDTAVAFPAPGTSYRKVYMIFTLGKYNCGPYYSYGCGQPGFPACDSAQFPWCGDWDYTILNYLMIPGGDTLEIARLISPYANNNAPRTPWTWTQRYVYDVTDYAYLLHDAATMRVLYSGYSGGFTANVKFAFIEGTPDRDVMKVRRLWTGSYGYNDTTHLDSFDINTHFAAVTDTVPTGTVTTDLKFLVTGHGNDANGCCEFAAHNYQVMLNGTSVATKTIWRNSCGLNELYPQSGTWLLERGNWCPGAMVYPNFHVLPGLTPGTGFNVAVQFDPYSGSGGSYTTEGHLIYYGAMNKTLDAGIEDIIAPTNNENHFRENPAIGQPVISIRNSGSTTIDSVTFQYGIQDSAMQTYTWVGTLASLQDTVINLAPLLNLNTVAGTSGTYNFIVTIMGVNGVADADHTNDTMRSQFIAAPVFPPSFRILFRTSNVNAYSSTTLAQTSWVLYDKSNNTIVRQRSNCALSTNYTDTVSLPTGYYQLALYDSAYSDGNYYGLNWWALAGAGYSPGYIQVRHLTGTSLITMNGYNYTGSYNNDFGQGFTQDFYVTDVSLGISNAAESNVSVEAYPNPAQGVVNVDISGLQNVQGRIEIMDMAGRALCSAPCNDAHQQINVADLTNGVYLLVYINNATGSKTQVKLLIAK